MDARSCGSASHRRGLDALPDGLRRGRTGTSLPPFSSLYSSTGPPTLLPDPSRPPGDAGGSALPEPESVPAGQTLGSLAEQTPWSGSVGICRCCWLKTDVAAERRPAAPRQTRARVPDDSPWFILRRHRERPGGSGQVYLSLAVRPPGQVVHLSLIPDQSC